MAELIEFPQPEYALMCQHCLGYVFRIWLGSPQNTDYETYECVECGAVFSFSDLEVEVDDGEP
jgi:hypothetical protein